MDRDALKKRIEEVEAMSDDERRREADRIAAQIGITPDDQAQYRLLQKVYETVSKDDRTPPEILHVTEMALTLFIQMLEMEVKIAPELLGNDTTHAFVMGALVGLAVGADYTELRHA